MCSALKFWKGIRGKPIKVCFVLQYLLRLGFLHNFVCQDWQFFLDSRQTPFVSNNSATRVKKSWKSRKVLKKSRQSRLVSTVWQSFSTSKTPKKRKLSILSWHLKPNINKVIGLNLDCYWLLISAYLFITFYFKNIKYVFNDTVFHYNFARCRRSQTRARNHCSSR